MNKYSLRPILAGIAALCTGALVSTAASAAPLTLNPLYTGAAPSGSTAGGLSGNWYKFQNDAYFSNYVYTDETGRTAPIKDYAWGSGIWAASDIAGAINSPYLVSTATSRGTVNYANNVYNNVEASGAYGSWAEDYQRPLAPIVGGANGCGAGAEAVTACASEFNYAAIFSGYLYVAVTGTYNFGVFADDGFNFLLTGSNGSIGMEQDFLNGRTLYDLVAMNGLDSLTLEQGYYAIGLSTFNRLESGVIDLGWRGPGATAWTTIDPGSLYNAVPEPATLALTCMAMFGLWTARRRMTPATRATS